MRSTWFFSHSLLVFMVLLAAASFAQPEVTRISGDVPHGSHVTIQGSSFGIKSPAAPIRYLDFEDGAVGDRLPGQSEGGLWNTREPTACGTYPSFSQGKQRIPGEIVLMQDYATGDCYNQTVGLTTGGDIDVSKLYITGWTYRHDINGTASKSSNQKMWGNFSCKGEITGNTTTPGCRVDSYWAADKGHMYADNCQRCDPYNMFDYYNVGGAKYFNQWMRMERYMDQGTVNGNDGWTFVGANLNILSEYQGSMYTTFNENTYEGRYQRFLIGHYFRRSDGGELIVYWGELYIDNTLARVEIGNAPTWSECTHREIQIPAEWNVNEITFQGNWGTFPAGSDLYVFVVNENNQASDGFPITLGGTASEGPGRPGQPVQN